jgi:gluconolactonase
MNQLISRRLFCIGCFLIALLLSIVARDSSGQEITIDGIGKFGAAEKLYDGFEFTEGPAGDEKGNVYFTDIPPALIYRLDSQGNKEVFTENSGHANGLMVDGGGHLLACQMDGKVVAYDVESKEPTVLAESYNEQRFNAPNDLVIDKTGGIYFTDPLYRAPTPLPQGKMAFYYRASDGVITRLGDDLDAPNGIILSPDEKTLYVIPSQQAEMMAYPIESPGVIGEGKVLCTLKQPEGQTRSGGDGLTIDSKGNLYITTGLGLQVVSPAGKILGILPVPEHPANVTFAGPDNKVLYITARTGLYQMSAPIAGHRFTGKAIE